MKRMFLANAILTVVLLSPFGFRQAKLAEYHSAAELKQEFDNLSAPAKAKYSGSGAADLGSYDHHAVKLSYRRETGGASGHATPAAPG